MSPVGLAARGRVLYVASGEHDRIVAFGLTEAGVPNSDVPFSETNEDKGSFPNAIAIATVDSCD